MKLRAYAAFVASLISFVVIVAFIMVPLVFFHSLRKRSAATIMRDVVVCGDLAFRVVCALMRIKPEFAVEQLGSVPRCVVVSNHQSVMDALVIPSLFKRLGLFDVRCVGKQEAAGYPLIGYVMQRCGVIFVGRNGNPLDRERVRDGALRAKHEGASVFIFPEGTRFAGKGPIPGSPYRHVLRPKRGGFQNIRAVMPDEPVLSVTLRWQPPVGERGDARTIFQAASYFEKTVYVTTRLIPAAEVNADALWLEHEWKRKDVELTSAHTTQPL